MTGMKQTLVPCGYLNDFVQLVLVSTIREKSQLRQMAKKTGTTS
jgi:hypothetical protein